MSSARGASGQGETSQYLKVRKNSPEMNVSGLTINPCESQLNKIKNKKLRANLRWSSLKNQLLYEIS